MTFQETTTIFIHAGVTREVSQYTFLPGCIGWAAMDNGEMVASVLCWVPTVRIEEGAETVPGALQAALA